MAANAGQVDGNGLVSLRARYYDPSTGRFLSRDPVAWAITAPLSLNRYTYALNNPLLLTDPSGMMPSNKTLGGDSDTCLDPSSHELCVGPYRIPLPGGFSVLGIDLFHGQDAGGGESSRTDLESDDPLVGHLAKEIERRHSRLVVPSGVYRIVAEADTGRKLAEFDIETDRSIIEVKSGSGNDLFAVMAAKALGYSRRDLGLVWRRGWVQLAILLCGPLLGWTEGHILPVQGLAAAATLPAILPAVLILFLGTGFILAMSH